MSKGQEHWIRFPFIFHSFHIFTISQTAHGSWPSVVITCVIAQLHDLYSCTWVALAICGVYSRPAMDSLGLSVIRGSELAAYNLWPVARGPWTLSGGWLERVDSVPGQSTSHASSPTNAWKFLDRTGIRTNAAQALFPRTILVTISRETRCPTTREALAKAKEHISS